MLKNETTLLMLMGFNAKPSNLFLPHNYFFYICNKHSRLTAEIGEQKKTKQSWIGLAPD
jgi:hypothetical protein